MSIFGLRQAHSYPSRHSICAALAGLFVGVGALALSAANVALVNPSFENGTTGWSRAYGTKGATTNSRAIEGSLGLYSGRATKWVQLVSGLQPATPYILKAFTRASAEGSPTVLSAEGFNGTMSAVDTTTSENYTQKTIRFTTGQSSTSVTIGFAQLGSDWGWNGLDAVSLESEGTLPPAVISIVPSALSTTESIEILRGITVETADALSGEVSIRYQTVSGSAIAGEDFVHLDQTLSISPENPSLTLSFQIFDDSKLEQSEHFFVDISVLSGNATIGSGRCTITITDDDVQTYWVNATAAGNGTVQVSPYGGVYEVGTVVTVTAQPQSGYRFSGWSGDTATTTNPLSFSVKHNYALIAQFQPLGASKKNSEKITLSGELYDAAGNPLGYPAPQAVNLVVSLHDDAVGGTKLYEERFEAAADLAVTVDRALFNARLGEGISSDNLAAVLATHENLWVEMHVNDEALQPRTPLTAAPYVMKTPAAGISLSGSGEPGEQSVPAPIGSYYINTRDNTTWLRLAAGWKKLD